VLSDHREGHHLNKLCSDEGDSYRTCKVNAVVVLAIFFKLTLTLQAGPSLSRVKTTAKVVPSLSICQHLRRPEYKDYITLTHTRKYRGVLQTHIASIMWCMFLYKQFTEVEAETVKQKRQPDWGLNPGPSKHIPDALTTELLGLTRQVSLTC
jgi:hypothetical protein